MNKILTVLLMSLFLMTASAQAKCPIADGPMKDKDIDVMVAEHITKLSTDLSLTGEQKGQVEGLMKEKMQKHQQLMEENRKAMDALQEDFSSKLSGVLTDEQKTKWESLKKDGHGEMKCPECKDGKMCKKCMLKMKKEKMGGHCSKCKDGKMCKKCMQKKAKEESEHEHK